MANTVPTTLRIVADGVIGSLKTKLGPIVKNMSTNISPEAGAKGAIASVYIASATSAQAFAGSYASILESATFTEKTLTFDEPLVAVSTISDTQQFLTSANIMDAQAKELADGLQKKLQADLHDLIVSSNYSSTSVLTAANHTVDGLAAMAEKADTMGLNSTRMAVLSPAAITALRQDSVLQDMSAASGDMVRSGNIGTLFDINVLGYQDSSWGNSESMVSYLCDSTALIFGSKSVAVSAEAQAAGVISETATDEDTGLTITIKYWYDTDSRSTLISAEGYYKFGVGNPASLHRYTSS